MASYRANKPSKDSTRQNKGFKRIKSFKSSNRHRKPDRSSSYNMHFKEDEEVFKDVETEPESDLDPELESFTCVIGNFDLDDSKSSCSIGSLSFRNSVENSETEDGYLAAFNRLKKPLKRLPNRLDLLLYDISIIDYIVNDRKWFRNDYIFNRGQLRILKIEGGPVIPKGSGTAVFIVLFYMNLLKYYEIVFEDVLYLFDIDVNLFSGLKHYKSGGYLEKNRLYTFQKGIITRLNIVKTGFFILLKDHKNNSAFVNFYYNSHKNDLYILIPAKPLKAGPNNPNALEGIIPKLNLYRPKDRQRSEVSEGINTG